ncbi:LysR family transcriptional regulator [Tistrella bauzanensis]|uniref:LysR family transcriptional regulator n=1 Tax=Tistrella arctica TaxID=3133430 RepID=A0ABU9YGL5_9PROT
MDAGDPDRMDLNLLKVFAAVMTERQVGRAAERLGITQAGASNALRRLRLLFDDELFLRTPRGVEPTARAIEVWPAISSALGQMRAALTPAAPFDPRTVTAEVGIGVTEIAELVLGPAIVRHLARAAPGLAPRFHHIDRRDAATALDDGTIWLALGMLPEPPPRITRIYLRRDPLLTLVPAGLTIETLADDGDALPVITLDGYAEADHVLVSATGSAEGVMDLALAEHGRKRRLLAVASTLLGAAEMAACAGALLTVVGPTARAIAHRGGFTIHRPPLELAPQPARLGLMFHRRDEGLPAHRWLRAEITRLARTI